MSYGYYETSPAGDATCVRPAGGAHVGSVFAGLVLVGAGGLLLAAQFVPGLEWWTLWPALIVVTGLVKMVTPGSAGWGIERVSDGFGTAFIGAALLGCTTGYIGWDMWFIALTLWPVLLVSAGISMIGHAMHQPWLRALAPVAVWAAIAYAAVASATGIDPVPLFHIVMNVR